MLSNLFWGDGEDAEVHIAEHRRVVKSMDPKNGIAMHVQETAHTIN